MSRCTECCQRMCRRPYFFLPHQPKSECRRKTFLFLASLVATLGSVAYCFYLSWLLAYVKDDEYYWFFAFIPALSVSIALLMVSKNDEGRRDWDDAAFYVLLGVLLMLMCSFTLLTRQAYYHLSSDVFIGPQWVIMSLKGSIVFFVCGFLALKECRLQKILKYKDVLTRGLLDFVDIFNLVELLSFNKCVGIGSSVTEGSSLEMAIQAFCTMSLLIMINVYDDEDLLINGHTGQHTVHTIYPLSVFFQNIPFLVIRIIVWVQYNVFSLGFMVKNILTIVVCCAEIFTKKKIGADDEQANNFNRTGQFNYGQDNASVITIQIGN